MAEDIEKIKTRIAKMLATAANDASTPGEKATAMGMASALMRKYNLERDDIDDINNTDKFNKVIVDALWARLTPWESRLAVFVSSYVVKGSFVVSSKTGGTGRLSGPVGQSRIVFTGLGPDAGMAAATFNQLRDLLVSQCANRYGSTVRGDGRKYAVGFVTGLNMAAQAAEKAEKSLDVGTALMRTDMLRKKAEQWYVAQSGGTLRSTSSNLRGLNSAAYNQGKADGMNANRGAVQPRGIGHTAGLLS